MFWLSSTVLWIPFYGFLVYCMIKQIRKRFWLVLLFAVATIALTDRITAGLMKPYFKRLRPSREAGLAKEIHLIKEENGQLYRGGQFGFASSHAANSFGLAMFIWLIFRRVWRYAAWLFLWAGVVSYTRIYLGVHYPLDIMAGAVIGVAVAYVMAFGYQRFFVKIFSSNSP
jgi:undecaprenyl-diphosphatase